jgi:hypothetical protein
MVASARIVREYEGVVPQLVSGETLGEGTGLSWREVDFAKLDAQGITETTELDNPQQLSDSIITVTPTVIAVHTVVTDRVKARIAKVALSKIGPLAQNAVQRKKDQDGITAIDGATTSLPGTGTTLTTGHLAAAASRVRYGGGNEPANPPFYTVLHPYQIKDIYDDVVAGVGTYTIPEGETARVFKEGFRGSIDGSMIYEDALISIDSTPDVKGGSFAKDAVVLVQGRAPRMVNLRNEKLGGGADEVILYDEYAFGERSSGNWLYEIMSDATAPTS